MLVITLFHILAGSTALLSGAVALSTRKGRDNHIAWGRAFAYSMIAMSLSGATLAITQGKGESVLGGLLAFHLTITGWLTVRETTAGRWWLPVLAGFALSVSAVALTCVAIGAPLVRDDAATFVVFGGILGLVGGVDAYRHFQTPITGRKRLLRHLWRMTFALLLACVAFFLGQADEFPLVLLRIEWLALPCVIVLIALAYWVWRTLSSPRARA